MILIKQSAVRVKRDDGYRVEVEVFTDTNCSGQGKLPNTRENLFMTNTDASINGDWGDTDADCIRG
jgi:hypothetical protein